jgi:hypothetical protein
MLVQPAVARWSGDKTPAAIEKVVWHAHAHRDRCVFQSIDFQSL